MGEIRGELDTLSNSTYVAFDSIEKIKVSTSRIGQSSDMIQSIASQTNLLSLNASIEEVLSMTEEIANGAAGIDDHYSDLNDIVSQYKL